MTYTIQAKNLSRELVDFIYQSPTAFHCVEETVKALKAHGFQELSWTDRWDLAVKGRYYITKNLSAVIAFTVNSPSIELEGFKIIGCHTDTPGFRIKPAPEMVTENAYLKLNTEVYGGPILNTWLDRPLAIAGRVTIKGQSIMKPIEKLVNINKPIAIIPNLAIHMNREVNKGVELNKQKDTLPLLSMVNKEFEKDNYLIKLVANELMVELNSILDFDLFLYEYDKGNLIGLEEEFISSPRMDDMAMVHASLKSLIDSQGKTGVNILACFDNEEVGSTSKQGADSPMLRTVLERICLSFNKDREDFFRALFNSFIISADLAHALHPNSPEKHDPVNKPIINKGPVIKVSANQKYTSDSYSIGVYQSICKEADVPYQTFVNRSDAAGGSTIGPINSSHIDIPSIDIGTPILAMHSIRELGGVMDHYYIYKSFVKFYEV